MCDIYGDTSDVWSETTQRARKPWTCCECGAPIPAGTIYTRFGSLFDGHWDTFRMHYECRVLWGSVAGDLCGHPGYVLAGGLPEELHEYGDEAAPYAARFEQIRQHYTEATP